MHNVILMCEYLHSLMFMMSWKCLIPYDDVAYHDDDNSYFTVIVMLTL